MACGPAVSYRQHFKHILIYLANIYVAVWYILVIRIFNTIYVSSSARYTHIVNKSTGPISGAGIYYTLLNKINSSIRPYIANAHIPIGIGRSVSNTAWVGFGVQ